MRRIIIKEARPGMVAARTLAAVTPKGETAVIAGTGEPLTIAHLARCHEAGLYDLWVTDPGLEFFDELCSQPTAAQVRLADALRDSFLRLSGCVCRSLLTRYDLVLEEVLRELLRTAPAVPCFKALTEDEALLAHACDVTAVSILLGVQLEGYLVEQRRRLHCKQARDVVNLALGALYHDVGELLLPPQQRESRRSFLETDAWKQHTEEGYALVRGRIDPSAAGIVLHHHQRFDGTGFAGLPAGAAQFADPGHRVLKGEAIHVYARIVMAADVFCQTLFAGARLPQPMVKTLWQIQQMPARLAFDPTVLQCLLGMFVPFVEGTVVALNDQRQALVTHVEGPCPCYPEVYILRGEASEASEASGATIIPLAERGDLRIAAVDGAVVEPYLYGARRTAPLAA